MVPSTERPGDVEVAVRLCSAGLTRTELIDAGNEIAKAIYAVPAHETVSVLTVSAWAPKGGKIDRQASLDAIRTEYSLFLWDNTSRPLSGNWK